jgi:hypothetical protein
VQPALFPLLLPGTSNGASLSPRISCLPPLSTVSVFPNIMLSTQSQPFVLDKVVLQTEGDRQLPGDGPAIRGSDVGHDAPRRPTAAGSTAQGNKAAALALKRMLMSSSTCPAPEMPRATPEAVPDCAGDSHSLRDETAKRGRSFADVNGASHFMILGTGAAAPSKLRSVSIGRLALIGEFLADAYLCYPSAT